MSHRTCNKCGWVHFGVSRSYAEEQIAEFNTYFATLSAEKQQRYYGGKGASMAEYEHCFRCRNTYADFRESVPKDCPDGCTIQPILYDGAA